MKQEQEKVAKRLINLRFVEDDLERFKALSQKTGLSVSHLIRIAARIGLQQIEEEPDAISKGLFA